MSTDRKKILVFADWYEPGFKAGGPIRSCVNFAENMCESHDIFVFTTDRDLGEKKPYSDIECDKWSRKGNVNILYASPSYLNWKNVRNAVSEIKPDYIYINSMFSRYTTIYPLLLERFGLTNATVVLAPRGMLKKSALQFKTEKKKIFLFIFKLLGIQKRITFHATDAREGVDIKAIFGASTKCVEVSNFPSVQQSATSYLKKEIGKLRIVFIGRIHPIKNLALLLEYIKEVDSEILLTIVGTIENDTYWKKCHGLIRSFSSNVTVVFKNDVPNTQIRNLITDHHIFALPTEGENFGHAIFEALSVGRPVLISDQTPWRNLAQEKAGWDLPLNEHSLFIAVLKKVANMDNDDFQQWSQGALQLANDYITKSDLKNQYLKLFS